MVFQDETAYVQEHFFNVSNVTFLPAFREPLSPFKTRRLLEIAFATYKQVFCSVLHHLFSEDCTGVIPVQAQCKTTTHCSYTSFRRHDFNAYVLLKHLIVAGIVTNCDELFDRVTNWYICKGESKFFTI